jgi:methylthioribulose-1-phosphate dehydratase
MVGTAGNLSARNTENTFWITASGKNKGELSETDFVLMDLEGEMLEAGAPESHPSAETSIHRVIYSLFPEVRACYHVHSVEANIVSNFSEGDSLPLPPLEMIKGLGIWQENPEVSIPLFNNYLEVPKIAEEIKNRFQLSLPQLPALLIRHHGVTIWASSLKEAYNRIEIIEYIFRYMVLRRSL